MDYGIWSSPGKTIKEYELNESLAKACERGDLEKVKELVGKGAKIYFYDNIPLCLASKNGHLPVVKFLLENLADLHADNDCPFRWAAENGQLSVVKFLFEKGADIHADYDYAFKKAKENGHENVLKFLQPKINKKKEYEKYHGISNIIKSRLKSHCREGNLEMVKFLYEEYPIIIDFNIEIGLKEATQNNHQDIVDFLNSKIEWKD